MKIPVDFPQQRTHDSLRQRGLQKKEKMKEYADQRQHSKDNDRKVGDTVLVRKTKKNKLSPPFDPKPFTVESRKGTMVTAKRGFQLVMYPSSRKSATVGFKTTP